MFDISCESKQQQISYVYSTTILYNHTFNTSITGLLPNTTYTCCVLAVTSYGESEPVCQNITTTGNTTSEFVFVAPSCSVLVHINNLLFILIVRSNLFFCYCDRCIHYKCHQNDCYNNYNHDNCYFCYHISILYYQYNTNAMSYWE